MILGSVLLGLLAIGIAVPAPEDEEITATDSVQEVAKTKPKSASPLLVAKVIDGDTIRLNNGKRVRLAQIDAPERSECFGRESMKVLKQLLPVGARIRLVQDRKLDDVDEHGRLLRYVYRGNRSINRALAYKGAASVWYFDGVEGVLADQLLMSAVSAEAGGRGVWGACEAELDPFGPLEARRKQKLLPIPKPAPIPEPEPAPEPETPSCHPSYSGACLDPSSYDYDCAGGSGDGPDYVEGPVYVSGDDPFGLDRDGDGVACES